MSLDNQINLLLHDYESGHSEFQIRQFIVNSEVHPWHKYKQCLREIYARRETIESKKRILETINQSILKLNSKKGRRFFGSKKKEIELAELISKKIDFEKKISLAKRELVCFVEAAFEIRSNHGFDRLNHDEKKYLEAEAWKEKAKFMLCLDIFCLGSIGKQTIEFIYKLPQKTKRELLSSIDIKDRNRMINYLVE